MASKIQICNMALSRLGASTITSLTDGTQEAKLCNTFFDTIADRVMMQGSWTSTLRRVTLAQTATTPTFGFTYTYQLPVDPKCLKVLNVDETYSGQVVYSIEDDKLLTDEGSVKIRYVAQLTDTEDWDPMLTEAVEIALGSYLALPITGNKTLAQEMRTEYQTILMNNLALNGQQGTDDDIETIDLTGIR
jgi:hypothetical protein